MSQSLAPECTPLKHAYDSCFNSWFAGYLQPQDKSKDSSQSGYNEEHTAAQVRDYQEKCGKLWKEYQDCVMVSVLFV